jgi:predicted acylesterase/phospholipase RssA/CRP-like cAMP-binding protein
MANNGNRLGPSAISPGVRDAAAKFQLVLRDRFLSGADPATSDPLLAALAREVDWVNLRGGQVLFRQGDPSTSLFIVVSGRLRAITQQPDGTVKVLNEIAAGEAIGEMGLITGSPRSATILALRDTCLAALSHEAFLQAAASYPQLLLALGRGVVNRLRRHELASPQRGVSTIAVVPVSPGVDTPRLAQSLVQSLSELEPAAYVPAARVEEQLGVGAASLAEPDLRGQEVSRWLNDLEDSSRFVVLEAADSTSAWTQRCVRHADAVLLVAQANEPCPPEPFPDFLVPRTQTTGRTPRTLVLLHPADRSLPSGTAAWLSSTAADQYQHLRLGSAADFSRLARSLAGCTIGLALGGGGARGLAHIGVVRALREAGIPIDAVGGTSMGAAIGAACALGWDPAEIDRLLWERLFSRKPFQRYTLPLISLVNDCRLERSIAELVGDVNIEDLWLPYFCISTNLTTSQMQVHRTGLLRRAVRASISLPGILPPVIDADNLLVDGGLMDNLPGDVMRELFGGAVIVVDVGRTSDLRVQSPRMPSPWQALKARLFGTGGPAKVPGILEILTSAAGAPSTERAARVRQAADLCLTPPVKDFGVLEFDSRARIIQCGYEYASRQIAQLHQAGCSSSILSRFLNRPTAGSRTA